MKTQLERRDGERLLDILASTGIWPVTLYYKCDNITAHQPPSIHQVAPCVPSASPAGTLHGCFWPGNMIFSTLFSFLYNKFRILCYPFRKKDFVAGIVAIMSFIWNILVGFLSLSFELSLTRGRAGLWHVTPQHGDSARSCTQSLCYTNWQHIE